MDDGDKMLEEIGVKVKGVDGWISEPDTFEVLSPDDTDGLNVDIEMQDCDGADGNK